MEFQTLLEKRRSIRSFAENTQVKTEDIEAMVKAALMAPSWKNTETGRYYAVVSPEMVEKLRTEGLPEFNQRSAAKAPALIVSTFKKSISGFSRDGSAENEAGDCWGAYDLGLQNENLILAASELGYDTLIMGIRDSEKIRTLLQIPEEELIMAVIAVGKRVTDPSTPPRKDLERVLKVF